MSDNIQIVQQIYAAFGRGDVAGIMEHISDDLRAFGVVSEQRLTPAHIQITTKQDVPQFFKALTDSAEFPRFEPRHFAAGGDQVYCTISLDMTFRHNRKKLTLDNIMHRFTFKNGKVVEWRGTEDTARTSAAYNAPAE
jgi:ketosteroid isomerase-like protein